MRYLVLFLFSLSIYSQSEPNHVLFIGNSLTYSNNLPDILKDIATNFNETVITTSLCYPNYGLEDHWNDGKIQKIMNKEHFNYVIIQQGPSSQMEGKNTLIEFGSKIKALCSKNGSQLIYFMVWPSKHYYTTFNGVIENHKLAAKTNNALLSPVGEIWQAYNNINGLKSLYGLDGFHPSKTGSFLSALILFKTMYPNFNLNDLSFENSNSWVTNKESYNTMIELINTKTIKHEN
ncbi:hypothetical protein DI383_02560 [Flavobacteriaceae bacterium LYZ1037]|nr:hypothetical protein DI383_02560 [Flavobacteriaceae bacterium LYZ1037]